MDPVLWALIIVFLYLTVGTVCAGITTRLMRGDSSLFGVSFFFWPIVMVIWFFAGLYAVVVGKKFYEIVR